MFCPVCGENWGPGTVTVLWATCTFGDRAFVSPPGGPGRPRCPPPRPSPPQSAACLPGDGFYLAVGGAVAQHNWSHITTVLQDQRFRCQLLDSSEDLGMISIQGPAR